MAKVKIDGYRCERCNHEWVPADKAKEPRVCPLCKSPYWNRPRQDKTKFAVNSDTQGATLNAENNN